MTGGESRFEIATSCETSESALDADVVIAFLDPPDAHHQRAVEVLGTHLVGGDGVLIAAIAYTEVCGRCSTAQTPSRRIPRSDGRTGGRCRPRRCSTSRSASSPAPRLQLPDAFSLATALAHSAELLTLDRGQRRIADHESEG